MIYEILEDFKNEILKYSDEYEIFVENIESIQLDSENENLNFAKEENNFGVGLRLISNGKVGFAYSSSIEDYKKIAEKAYLNSKLNEIDENFSFSYPDKYNNVKGIYDKKFKDIELDELTDFMKTLINTVKEENCEVTSAGFNGSSFNSVLINSNGVDVSNTSTSFYAHIAVNATKGGEKSTYYDSLNSREFNLNPVELSKNVCEIAKNSIGGVKIETGDNTIVLDYHASTGLLNTFISAFNGDNVLRGRSIFHDKLSQEITSLNLSIYDNGIYEGGLLSNTSDNEGIPCENTILVKDGILKGFVYDIYNSNKQNAINNENITNKSNINENNNQKSTGNGFRGYNSNPSISNTNIIFDFKDLRSIEEIKNGIIATDVLGAHTANPISGDFSVEINNPFLIENGEVTKPIKKAMLSGNIFEAIKSVNGLKSEIIQRGQFIIPKLICDSLRVVG